MNEPKGITSLMAWQLLQSAEKTVLVDVRSNMEYTFVGHPIDAELVPWMDDPDWEVDPDFPTEVQRAVTSGDGMLPDDQDFPTVILICRSGNRSLAAGKCLLASGFLKVLHIEDGFEGDLNAKHQRNSVNGWRFHGLPWKQC